MSKIILYTQKCCPQCKVLEDLLDKHKVQYEKNTDLEEMSRRNITHTPMMDVDGELVSMATAIKMINEGLI